jgi:hypothetical protein
LPSQSTVNPEPTGQCTINTETGSGFAPHLEKWTWSDQQSVQFVSCPPHRSAIVVTGQFVIAAANGGEIFRTLETTGALDPVNGVSPQGSYIFVSGTGRSVTVTGSGIITGHGSASSLVGSIDGVISYQNGKEPTYRRRLERWLWGISGRRRDRSKR